MKLLWFHKSLLAGDVKIADRFVPTYTDFLWNFCVFTTFDV
jgi:hypothetical protein